MEMPENDAQLALGRVLIVNLIRHRAHWQTPCATRCSHECMFKYMRTYCVGSAPEHEADARQIDLGLSD